ncbi:transposase [Leisingera methylohalidivorans]|uniref:Transposase IS4-like domain-containing protein n=1 Tax=Leisingera methylohalidivorans DSM 14336 TaxID=999552 RepID=V9VY44_9RHOB|nr:hypothetical protein METH_22770 [Leisingera methylohalidivorans DSM 14336]
MEEKHGARKRRKTWRKLHIGFNPLSGGIVAASLTIERVGDRSAVAGLLRQLDGPVAKIIADRAYDGSPV